MKLSIIVAAARNGVIGRDNQLPWHLPQDLQYFKATTMGKPILMGRKTYESIGKPLPGRTNIVITRDTCWKGPEGVIVVHSVKDAVAAIEKAAAGLVNQPEEAMVIGGAEIYRETLPLVERIYLTKIESDIEGDARFPILNDKEWHLSRVTAGDVLAPLQHTFLVYDRCATGS